MRALQIDHYQEDVVEAIRSLHVIKKPVPNPKAGQVLVRVETAPCNPSDLLVLQGRYGRTKTLPAVPCWEGVVLLLPVGYFCKLKPEQAREVFRSHWTVENRLHWNVDVNVGEDSSLAATSNAAENLAALKRLSSTMIPIDLGGIPGTAQGRRQAAWEDSWSLGLLSRIF